MVEPTPIATIPSGQTEEMRVALETVRGQAVVDVRIFADFKAGPATVRGPTRQGLSVPVERLPELIRALHSARAELERMGAPIAS